MKKVISLLLSLPILLSFSVMSSAQSAQDTYEYMSLAEIYKDYFLIGSIFSPHEIPNSEHFEAMKKDYNVLTAENAMKPDHMQARKAVFTHDGADKAIGHIQDAGMLVVGHTLAWHAQSPGHLNKGVTREQAEQNLADHINGVAGHYAGKILAWDVLNEAIQDGSYNSEDWRSALRRSDWFNAFAQGGNGEDYVYMAFKLAREADPNAILYYNDYNLNVRTKALAVYYMVKELNEKYLAEGNDRLLIEGVGMQGHYSMNTSISSVEESIKLFAELGVEVSITELDVTVPGASGSLSEEDELKQAIVYAQLFKTFREHKDVIARVTLWGLNDKKSWRGDQFPLLLNGDYSPKLSYFAVADPEGFMEEHNVGDLEIVKRLTGTVTYGTPEIDGEVDEIWSTAEVLPVDQMLQAWHTAKGTARLLWDDEYLYILVEVSTTELDKSAHQPHEHDTVEIYFCAANCKSGSHKSCDKHIRVRYDNHVTYGASGRVTGFESGATESTSGYIVEMKIPFENNTPEAGMTIGFDAQINDAKNGGRVGIAKWNDPSDESYLNTEGWGEAKLINDDYVPEEKSEEPEEVDEKSQEEETVEVAVIPEEPEDDSGFLIVIIIIGAVVAVGVVGFAVFMKKRKVK